MTRESSPCHEGGNAHAWKAGGLDLDIAGQLVSTRRCVWCGRVQQKSYGAGGKSPWKTARPAPDPVTPTQ